MDTKERLETLKTAQYCLEQARNLVKLATIDSDGFENAAAAITDQTWILGNRIEVLMIDMQDAHERGTLDNDAPCDKPGHIPGVDGVCHYCEADAARASAPDPDTVERLCPGCGDPLPEGWRARVCRNCGEDAEDRDILTAALDNERQDLVIEFTEDSEEMIIFGEVFSAHDRTAYERVEDEAGHEWWQDRAEQERQWLQDRDAQNEQCLQ